MQSACRAIIKNKKEYSRQEAEEKNEKVKRQKGKGFVIEYFLLSIDYFIRVLVGQYRNASPREPPPGLFVCL